ncbi:MAG: phosphatidate cytidylyltransferase [Marinifilaceae bacterium]
MNNFIKRSLTGILFVIILISGITLHPYGFYAVFLAITVLGIYEFYNLAEKSGIQTQKKLGTVTGVILFSSCFLQAISGATWGFLVLTVFLVASFIRELYRQKEQPFGNLAYTFLGLIYVGLPFSLMTYLAFPFHDGNFHYELVLGIFVMIWANDTGAYVVGVNFGKHRLFERISPKKSWEGSIGGAIIALAVAWISSMVCQDLTLWQWLVVGALVVVFGSLGDLVESLFKRSLDIKDSGNILPGHGGILDRFDAVLLAVPMVFVFLQAIKEFMN